uniref:Uncharacterized protein n=1 Tax=Arundo donax TaxID=35708 RepID=A0A0A9FEZ2_ARUDO
MEIAGSTNPPTDTHISNLCKPISQSSSAASCQRRCGRQRRHHQFNM